MFNAAIRSLVDICHKDFVMSQHTDASHRDVRSRRPPPLACSSASFLKLSGATSQSNPHSGAQDLAKAVENLLEYYKTAKAEEEKAVTQLTVKAETTRVSKQ